MIPEVRAAYDNCPAFMMFVCTHHGRTLGPATALTAQWWPRKSYHTIHVTFSARKVSDARMLIGVERLVRGGRIRGMIAVQHQSYCTSLPLSAAPPFMHMHVTQSGVVVVRRTRCPSTCYPSVSSDRPLILHLNADTLCTLQRHLDLGPKGGQSSCSRMPRRPR